jgi:hypothetical protein
MDNIVEVLVVLTFIVTFIVMVSMAVIGIKTFTYVRNVGLENTIMEVWHGTNSTN